LSAGWGYSGILGSSAESNTIGDQRGEVGLCKADTWCRLAIVLDVRILVQMVRKRARQFGNIRMRLRVIPTNRFLIFEDRIAIVEEFAIGEIEVFENAELQTVPKPDASTNETRGGAISVEMEGRGLDFGVRVRKGVNQALVRLAKWESH
jgi:hypothetical protein